MNKIFTLFLVIFLITGFHTYAQPPSFTLSGTSVAQTCLGNGSVSLIASGNDPTASMEYAAYLLPNTTTPVTTVTTPLITGLVSGTYQIVATQLLNGSSNTATATIIVGDNVVPLQYNTTGTYCNGDGTITVNVTSGNAVSYEILAGPVIRPLQSSNIFTGLPQGQYQVRVFNNCGEGLVTTVQLTIAQADLILINPVVMDGQLPSCNTIMVQNGYTNNFPMLWPLTFEYKVYPPSGGTPVIITKTEENYGQGQVVTTEIPFYNNQMYSYYLKVTDACGNNNTQFYTINESYNTKLISVPGVCGVYTLGLELSHYVAPYTVNFTTAPAGFDPAQYNSQHPSFSDAYVVYGTAENPVPFGDYTVQVTDACGRIATADVEVTDILSPEVQTFFSGTNGCSGTIIVKAPPGRNVVTAQLTAGPPGYAPVPQNLDTYINNGVLKVSGLPPGTYTIILTDECNNQYTVNATIEVPPVEALNVVMLAGCGPDEGTINISFTDLGYGMQGAVITQAPPGFGHPLPYDVSGYIFNAANLLMDALPEGNYYISTTDFCGNVRESSVLVNGFEAYQSNVEVLPHCGSFDIYLLYQGNNAFNQGFWLQAYNEETGTWGHPLTGAYSPEGFLADGVALALQNSQVNYNFQFDGQFRVVHSYFVYGSGINGNTIKQCSDVITTFIFHEAPKIVEAYAYPCTNGLSEVVVYAEGVAPLSYQITQKNGAPFLMNGDENVFAALEDGTYTFTVTDACNNIVNRQYDITDLKPMEIRAEGLCAGEASSLSVREFSFLTYEWWYEDNPDEILSTAHDLVFAAFNPETQAGIYYLKVVSVTPGSCIDAVVQYEVVPAAPPDSGNDAFISICNRGQKIDLTDYLEGNNNDSGIWEDTFGSGALNGAEVSLAGLEAGQYDFTYTTYGCNSTDQAVIHVEVIGANSFPVTLLADCVEGKYTIVISNLDEIDAAEILWTGPAGYAYYGNIADINGLKAGTYTVTVTNTSGCVSTASVLIENTHCFIPKGISPGDSDYNNNFDLSNLGVKHITIFNRYGLLVYEKDNYLDEWYGQSDKGELPTGTYFYVLNLAEGKQVTGWVYLLRKL